MKIYSHNKISFNAFSLRESSKIFMENFGSQLFGNVKFRDSYVIIGQRGIAKGKAIEFVWIVLNFFYQIDFDFGDFFKFRLSQKETKILLIQQK